ncbi:tyrosine-type recombinase/integrase [Bradyrhizobium sp. STM 3561]|uniref:tyrosine-type recombinase/integrase n=1 Tax=Bradyrhizobium sp. STM 3561 TaxID=578923 RepID=UPI00388F6E45
MIRQVDLDAVAVEFDLVNPPRSGRHLLDRGCQGRFDEAGERRLDADRRFSSRQRHSRAPHNTNGDSNWHRSIRSGTRESNGALGFRNEKHKAQWKSTLETYAASLRAKPVDTISTDDVLAALKPIWTTKAETASRVRGRIEKVLDAAKAKGFREGENPARWRGHLDHLLPKPSKLARGHHPAMAYEQLPAFIADLRLREATAALALEFCILTAARSGEVLGMLWSEIDFDKKTWTVPAKRMKAGRQHRVPLSSRAVAILRQLEKLKTSDFVFAGQKRNRPLSNMAMDMMLRRTKVGDVTVHGFRSSFRDWAGNVSSFPREIVETALAHVIGDKAEQAYRRSDALDKRRKLMEAWAAYCEPKTAANAVPIRRRKSH